MAQITQISQGALYALWLQLSADGYGFNAQISNSASTYGINAFTIDFGANFGDGGAAFFYGLMPPDLYEAVGSVADISDIVSDLSYILISIDTINVRDERTVTYATFAGKVPFVIQVTISFSATEPARNFGFYKNAIEDAIYSCLNAPSSQQYWPPGTIYDPHLTMNITQVISPKGGNLRQTLTFTGQFTRIAA